MTEVLEIILYSLGAILLAVLIVLGIKLIKSVDRINVLLDDVEDKMKTVDKVFAVIDRITDSFASVSDRVVDGIARILGKLFSKKKKKIEEEEDDI